jgi:endonuclease/exonuclease/phosphatase family metal-dependent hydrolase
MTTLRVATLNIWGRSGPWPDRLRLIRRELRRLTPDVIGLQEVIRHGSGEGCQAREIADGLGYDIAYAPATECDPGTPHHRHQGNAVLSRLPILDRQVFALPTGTAEPRSLLYARLATPYGELPVFVTHLDWQFHHGPARLRQIRFVVDRIAELRGDDLPPVLMGDLNAEPDADEIRYLRGLAVVDGTGTYFADAWTYGGDGTAGATFDRTNDYARAAREPSRRIDYIFTAGDDHLRGEPMRTELAFTVPETSNGVRIWPSDHFGLVTDLMLAPR